MAAEQSGPRRRLCALIVKPRLQAEATARSGLLPLSELADWAIRFSPLVEPALPNALLADITGCEHLFGGEAGLVRQFADGLERLGWESRVAVADTVGAAYALAYAGGKPQIVAPPSQTRQWLTPLPVAALRLDPPVCQRLEQVGIRTIGDLLRLPRAALGARFGPQPLLRLHQALGEVFEGVAVRYPPTVLGSRIELDPPAEQAPRIERALELLLGELFQQLERAGCALQQLECILYAARTPPRVLSIEFVRPCRVRKHVTVLLKQRLEQISLAEGITGLALVARQTAPWQPEQKELFSEQAAKDEELTSLLDRLINRLGHEAVVQAQPQDDYQPEAAFRYVPIGQAFKRSGSRTDAARGRPRPTLLLSRPRPVRAISRVPDGPPTWLSFGGCEYVVAAAEGPERLETGWWRGPEVRRDYFHVTTTTGQQFWVFRDLTEQRWYLHGVFS